MTFLASRRWRIFLIAWMLYTVHFATNVVREHYPAFSIAEHGTFTVDEYQGFHSDIFELNGHSVIGNQVFTSVLVAVPLFIFDPVLDALEAFSKRRLARDGVTNDEYRTDKPNRINFFRIVKARGLDLRFGAVTFITVAFFMAPATALFLVGFYGVLRRRGVGADDASVLTFLLGLGTPVFFRATTLSHNLVVTYAMFAAFVLLWSPAGQRVSLRNRLLAGLCGGLTLATDYIGVIILPLLYAYLVLPRARASSWRTSLTESLAMIAGAVPAVCFLLYSQWAMYGSPFYPGQHWMPDQNVYVTQGLRGFTLPSPDLFLLNLFDPAYGLYAWAPLLLLALVPARWYRREGLIVPVLERRFIAITWISFLLFTSANQYSRLQFNSGLRYLLPLVPFLMLVLADHWVRLDRRVQTGLAAMVVLHAWVLTVFRESLTRSWELLFTEGPQLPWYRVLSMTANPDNPWLGTWWLPTMLLGATLAVAALIWRRGHQLEVLHGAQ